MANDDAKPVKVKENHQLSFAIATNGKPGEVKAVESYSYELAADLLPPGNDATGYNGPGGYAGEYPAYGPYPYYAGGYGYPYAYPGFYPGFYGYGYPFAYGVGFGYYGGFRGGYGGFRR